jgi:hypothetical protein
MIERTQPVVKGLDKNGELKWGKVPMPYWQMAMFPVKYVGDFFSFWARLSLFQKADIEIESSSSMELRFTPWKKKARKHQGD